MAISVPLRRLAPVATAEVGTGAVFLAMRNRGPGEKVDEDRRFRYL